MNRAYLDTPIGRLRLEADAVGLSGVYFPHHKGRDEPPGASPIPTEHPALASAQAALEAYFAGRAPKPVKLSLRGTPFQVRVWAALQKIPRGETVTYGALAAQLGAPNAARAVGTAVGANPISILIPCHRVVAAGGGLGGFAGGLARKRALLAFEAGAPLLLEGA